MIPPGSAWWMGMNMRTARERSAVGAQLRAVATLLHPDAPDPFLHCGPLRAARAVALRQRARAGRPQEGDLGSGYPERRLAVPDLPGPRGQDLRDWPALGGGRADPPGRSDEPERPRLPVAGRARPGRRRRRLG